MRLKCANCGFINFPHDAICKRCKSDLGEPLECRNVWRDGKRLVVSMYAPLLPKRCLKCGAADYLDREVLDLTHTPLLAYVTVFMNFVYWREIELEAFLCTSHRRSAERQTFQILPNILIVAGACSILLALTGDNFGLRMMLFFGGALMLAAGIFFVRVNPDPIKIVKRNKKYLWITGVDQNLLAQLENFDVSR